MYNYWIFDCLSSQNTNSARSETSQHVGVIQMVEMEKTRKIMLH